MLYKNLLVVCLSVFGAHTVLCASASRYTVTREAARSATVNYDSSARPMDVDAAIAYANTRYTKNSDRVLFIFNNAVPGPIAVYRHADKTVALSADDFRVPVVHHQDEVMASVDEQPDDGSFLEDDATDDAQLQDESDDLSVDCDDVVTTVQYEPGQKYRFALHQSEGMGGLVDMVYLNDNGTIGHVWQRLEDGKRHAIEPDVPLLRKLFPLF